MIIKNITLLGHKDHGKSTLIGNLLIQTKSVTPARINEAKKTSKKLGRQFEPGYILDSFSEEREQEMTIDTTRAEMAYKDLAFAFIDVPGHEELIKNMISGASYAEIALLMVSAKKEEGIKDQTKRHLFIAKMLGINKLIIAVNKMDLVGYSEDRFNQIRKELGGFIAKIGFKASNFYFVPVSAYNADNLIKKSGDMSWYKGKPLVELLYEQAKMEDKRKSTAPLRIVIQGAIESGRQTVVGKVISGRVKTGSMVSILPFGYKARIESIVVKGKKAKSAGLSDDVALTFESRVSGNLRGTVVAEGGEAPKLTDKINSLIFVTGGIKKPLKLRINGNEVKCKALEIAEQVDTTTGDANEKKGAEVLNAVRARIVLEKKVPIEDFDEVKELGRFVLYGNNKFAGIGIISP
ncbi:MAG: 50S ribosome-binding GTPase [Candidatus Micrarchaeota archaeon]|nr:50S ribosome-binding GTPase [Candidatus Micrarchaeota archaeon]MDE1864429.1 50S ribosome-binding GTPase [Candidatus Micrarchaeota archaeon]